MRDFKKTINEIKNPLNNYKKIHSTKIIINKIPKNEDSKKIVRDIAFELRDLFVFIKSESQKNNDEKAQIIEK